MQGKKTTIIIVILIMVGSGVLNSTLPTGCRCHNRQRKEIDMKPEGKELLCKDLCARLPYGVKVQYNGSSIRLIQAIGIEGNEPYFKSKEVAGWLDVGSCKPYLRPMSSMTEEEKMKLSLSQIYAFTHYNEIAKMDWLNEHHFDYRGLIDRGLAIEVTKDNNPYKG